MTHTGDVEMRVRVLLSMQRALLGAVTPALRGVAVTWNEHRISARFVYDASGDYVDLVQETETQVLADFDDDVTTDFTTEVATDRFLPLLSEHEVWAYRRHEG